MVTLADHFEHAVMAVLDVTPAEWAAIPRDERERLVHVTGQRVWGAIEALYGPRRERHAHGHLPGIYMRPDYTVGTFITRRERRWTVALRLPDGGMVYLAEYRWHWRAALWVRRSWKLARR